MGCDRVAAGICEAGKFNDPLVVIVLCESSVEREKASVVWCPKYFLKCKKVDFSAESGSFLWSVLRL